MNNGLAPKRWDLLKAAGIGAFFGALYSVGRAFLASPEYFVGAENVAVTLGGALGGAVLFGLVAGARNFIMRAK